MPLILQNLLVLLAVAACIAYLARALRKSLTTKCGEKGSCCSSKAASKKRPLAHEKIAFLPVEMLSRKK